MRKSVGRKRNLLSENSGVEQLRTSLLRDVRAMLIPAAQLGNPQRVVLGQPPLRRLWSRSHRKDGERAGVSSDLKPLRFPRYCFVLEGEADVRLGMEEEARRDRASLMGGIPFQVVSVAAGQILVLPAGVPQDSSAQIQRSHHWFRPEPQIAPARLFWLIALPDGMLLHTCATRSGVHTTSAELFAKDEYLFTLTGMIITELRTRGLHYETITQNCLAAILARVERALVRKHLILHAPDPALIDSEGNPELAVIPHAHRVIQRACEYVESHIHEELSPFSIAATVHLSPRHLSRTFRQVTGATVMGYVTNRRVETAKTLLTDTHLPINEIGKIVGLPDATCFGRVFRQASGCSPSAFRKSNGT